VIDLGPINGWSEEEARAAFLRCCGSTRWAERMAASRPFREEADLLKAAEDVWHALGRADWLEAFAAHPPIGDLDALRAKFAATRAWSVEEQAGVAGVSDEVLRGLAEGNRAYRDRFGYTFIVCATGRTAGEMLDLLRQRLANDPDTELRAAAAEQARITRLRLGKLTP
jgi:2-oxo-4-hydroxy-4-carboxy-5-ureidoimidazoline decarboxylase